MSATHRLTAAQRNALHMVYDRVNPLIWPDTVPVDVQNQLRSRGLILAVVCKVGTGFETGDVITAAGREALEG